MYLHGRVKLVGRRGQVDRSDVLSLEEEPTWLEEEAEP
jgi:hypothetical protein